MPESEAELGAEASLDGLRDLRNEVPALFELLGENLLVDYAGNQYMLTGRCFADGTFVFYVSRCHNEAMPRYSSFCMSFAYNVNDSVFLGREGVANDLSFLKAFLNGCKRYFPNNQVGTFGQPELACLLELQDHKSYHVSFDGVNYYLRAVYIDKDRVNVIIVPRGSSGERYCFEFSRSTGRFEILSGGSSVNLPWLTDFLTDAGQDLAA